MREKTKWVDSELSEFGGSANQKRFLKKQTRKSRRAVVKKNIRRDMDTQS